MFPFNRKPKPEFDTYTRALAVSIREHREEWSKVDTFIFNQRMQLSIMLASGILSSVSSQLGVGIDGMLTEFAKKHTIIPQSKCDREENFRLASEWIAWHLVSSPELPQVRFDCDKFIAQANEVNEIIAKYRAKS